MEVNKDEAIRCLSISQKHLEAGNFPSARKFCLKSIVLFETPEARKLLNRIDNLATSSSTRSHDDPAGSVGSQTAEHPSAAGMKHRHAQPKTNGNGNGTAGGMGGDKREYTTEQEAVVKRVKSYKATAYYDILLVKKDCDEAEIKKAYRKVSFEIAIFSLII
jgi:DnaJ family protein B protein 12